LDLPIPNLIPGFKFQAFKSHSGENYRDFRGYWGEIEVIRGVVVYS
jgi:hypothetical protein